MIKVLIVEDESIIAMTYKAVFIKRKIATVIGIFNKAEHAIKQINENLPDVIIMDIKLKGDLDGIEAAKLINKKLSVPIIFITGNSDKKTKERALSIKPLAYLEKPVNLDILCQTMQTVV